MSLSNHTSQHQCLISSYTCHFDFFLSVTLTGLITTSRFINRAYLHGTWVCNIVCWDLTVVKWVFISCFIYCRCFKCRACIALWNWYTRLLQIVILERREKKLSQLSSEYCWKGSVEAPEYSIKITVLTIRFRAYHVTFSTVERNFVKFVFSFRYFDCSTKGIVYTNLRELS